MSKTAIVKFRDFSGGLNFSGGTDEISPPFVVSNKCARPGRRRSYRIRQGTDRISTTNYGQSIVRYNDQWYQQNTSGYLYLSGTTEVRLNASLSTAKVSWLKMPPTAGIQDYLFGVEGTTPFKLGADTYVSGTELVTNGTMESGAGPDNWTDYGTPTTSERSTEQVHTGTYSNKIVVDAANEGTQSDDFTTTDYTRYRVRLYVYPDDTTAVTVKIRHGDDSGWLYDTEHDSLTQDAWNEIEFITDSEEAAGGAGAYLVIESGDDTSGTYYIDTVSIQAVEETVAWGIEPPANYITVAEGAAGNLSGTYQYGMTYLNSITGTRSNSPSTGDTTDTKLLLHMEGATTSFSDSSVYTQTVTAAGDATQSDAAARFGSKSMLLDGTGDYITVTYDASLELGSETFCIEGWVRFDSVAGGEDCYLFDIGSSGTVCRLEVFTTAASTGAVGFFYAYGATSFWVFSDTFTAAADTFYHIALIRGWNGDPNKFAITVDGVEKATTVNAASITLNSNDITIGKNHDGYIDEVRITIGDSVYRTAFTPSTTAFAIFPSVTVASKKVSISGIPESDDPQVDIIELWRTVGDGSVLFKLVEIPNGTTTYTDNTDDDFLSNTELPVDNIKPFQYFTDCFGPYNASAFWLADSEEGQRGRVFYSAVGRAEAMQGYIEVSGDDLPLKKGCVWQGYIYVFGEDGIYQVYGSNPYYSRKVDPVGISVKESLAVTPFGICYEAKDGPRIFDGNRSQILGKGTIENLFRGEAHGQLSAFTSTTGTYGRGEYYLANTSAMIAYDLEDSRWRDCGRANIYGLYYAEDSDQLAIGTSALGLLDFEKEGENDDYGTGMAMHLETSHIRIASSTGAIVKQVHIDHDSSSETLTVYLVHDGTATSIGTCTSASRERDTLQANTYCREFGIRITGTIDADVEVFGIDVELYLPNEEEL